MSAGDKSWLANLFGFVGVSFDVNGKRKTNGAGEDAANVVVGDSTTGGKTQITSTVGGIKTPSITVSSALTTVIKALVIVNTQDDVEAATALKNEYDNVFSVMSNEIAARRSPASPITRVSVIILGTGGTAGTTVPTKRTGDTEAEVALTLRTFEFLSADNVRDINIGLLDNGTAADVQITCEGFANV